MVSVPHMSERDKFAALELQKAGLGSRKIAAQLSFSQRSINRFFKRQKEDGDRKKEERRGRRRLSTAQQDAVLEKLCLADRKKSASQLNKEWKKKTKVKVCRKTVNNRLLAAKLPARTPRKKPLKSEKIRERRLQFALDHLNWTVDDWKKVAFSDETWCQERENGRLQWVRRRVGEAHNPECVVNTTKHPLKVMMFGCITPTTKTKLCFIDGNVDAKKYVEVLTEVKIVQFLKDGRRLFSFMEDGAPAHRAMFTKAWQAAKGITLFQGWPGNSPDLNPIENLWSQVKHLQREERATSKEGIKKIAKKVWRQVTPEYLESLYQSMPRRMQAVVDVHGGHTKY